MFRRVLIANRGEIAVRLIRGCHEMGIEAVAIYSEADASAPHVLCADDAVYVGPPPSAESYLSIERIIDAVKQTGAEAVHPGYGFLAENATFARAVADAGLTFIGPRAEAIAAMGDKVAARKLVVKAGVPVVPAVEDVADASQLPRVAADIGYPFLIKAAAGGGGKGMRIVRSEAELAPAFAAAAREAQSAFGDGRLFVERYIERPRHVEVQVFGDQHGNIIHLSERECSIQRRHQKIIEETPSPALTPALREQMTAAAVAAARSVNYSNAGTVEFLLDQDGRFYFLEMNTRLQVEHPVTEWVAGIDLVHAQLRVAAGERLWLQQSDIHPRGHSIECRIYAEDAAQKFLPSPGTILHLREPGGPGVRVDSGIRAGYTVPIFYDPMLAKVSVWDETRDAARRRMIAALRAYVVLGCTTSIPFLIDVLDHPAFASGDTHTHFIEEHFPSWHGRERHRAIAAIAAAIDTTRPQRAVNTGGSAASASPWTTLGHWRVGADN
ncbi:MAG: acetyl-CoA carboxylase biotin carboxylase subunit [Deltaproteobacteria bacterium]|nr:acetyl-CoA carboxylase biotin carboxylase subunit [Deltaproteobacteria bacterium]MBI3389644.1 acetyl-CoA carboxylase biotin carboxylase subunit [Deltaproteobacteria bacterium]